MKIVFRWFWEGFKILGIGAILSALLYGLISVARMYPIVGLIGIFTAACIILGFIIEGPVAFKDDY